MNVSGIRPYSGYSTYNNYIRTERPENYGSDLATQEAERVAAKTLPKEEQRSVALPERKETFGAIDYAAQYNPKATYELKGQDSDLKTLDVEKAISDMQKDDALRQYQFFVRNARDDVKDAMAAERIAEQNFQL